MRRLIQLLRPPCVLQWLVLACVGPGTEAE
jgi:hypothetical protein